MSGERLDVLIREEPLVNGMTANERNFFTHANIGKLQAAAGLRCAWDWNTSLGETIMEKYESLYVKVHEITNILIAKGAKGLFWLVTSPEIGSIFESATAGFAPAGCFSDGRKNEQIEMGVQQVLYLGTINRRWRIYTDTNMAKDTILIGANWDENVDPRLCSQMTVANFIR